MWLGCGVWGCVGVWVGCGCCGSSGAVGVWGVYGYVRYDSLVRCCVL